MVPPPAAATAAAAEGKDSCSMEFVWSKEMHSAYIHSLEVSFVRRVFGGTAADHFLYYHLNGYDYHHQPLDRHLPDSCDSTLDSTTLDHNHAKQYCEADAGHSKGKRCKTSKKTQTSLAPKAPQKDQASLESVTGSSSGRGGGVRRQRRRELL